MSLMFSLARSTLTQLLVAQLMGSRLMRLATRLRKFRLWHIDDAAGQVAHFLERRLLRRNSLRRGFGNLFHTLAFRRFGPRLKCGLERASRRGWGEVCPDQIAIGQPLAQQGIYHRNEPLPVAGPAIVAPEHLLAQVARDVEGVHADVGPANGPLQQAPEILDAVRVDPADAVLALGTLQSTDDGARSPVVATSRIAGHQPTPLRYTHVLDLPTQERFVNLSCAAQGVATSMRHRGPDAPQHEPRGFLGDVEGPAHFVGADPILGVGNQPQGREPLVQPERGILEDRADLDGELLAAGLCAALPDPPGRQKAGIVGPAMGAFHAIGPAESSQEPDGVVGVREVDNGVGQTGRSALGFEHTVRYYTHHGVSSASQGREGGRAPGEVTHLGFGVFQESPEGQAFFQPSGVPYHGPSLSYQLPLITILLRGSSKDGGHWQAENLVIGEQEQHVFGEEMHLLDSKCLDLMGGVCRCDVSLKGKICHRSITKKKFHPSKRPIRSLGLVCQVCYRREAALSGFLRHPAQVMARRACHCSGETGITESRPIRTSAKSLNRESALTAASVTGVSRGRSGAMSTTTRLGSSSLGSG